MKKFNVKDGLGIKLLQGVGIEIVFMSGGSGGAAEERAKQLGIKSCLVGVKDKYRELRTLQQEMKVTKSDTIYVGDDINDLVVKPLVNLLFAPSNASMSLLKKVDLLVHLLWESLSLNHQYFHKHNYWNYLMQYQLIYL